MVLCVGGGQVVVNEDRQINGNGKNTIKCKKLIFFKKKNTIRPNVKWSQRTWGIVCTSGMNLELESE